MRVKVEKALRIIKGAIEKYDRIAVAASFGKDSMVLAHLCNRIEPDIQIFSVMTPHKFKTTFDYKNHIAGLYDWNIRTYMAEKDDDYLPPAEECCEYYKVTQVKKAIEELQLDAWFSGMRATEGETRRDVPIYQEDCGLMKVNPILDFTESEIYLYHCYHRIPIHPLYYEGYRSLGCEPCTVKGGLSERDGRWKGTSRQGGECNIHTRGMRSGKCLT